MARELRETVRVMSIPWKWGTSDCCTAACDVFFSLFGVDPMKELRDKYSTELGAAKQTALRGGFLPMCEGLAKNAGLVEGEGSVGEIGVAKVDGDRLGLVICIAPGVWAAKTLTGFLTVTDVLRSWKCHQQ